MMRVIGRGSLPCLDLIRRCQRQLDLLRGDGRQDSLGDFSVHELRPYRSARIRFGMVTPGVGAMCPPGWRAQLPWGFEQVLLVAAYRPALAAFLI